MPSIKIEGSESTMKSSNGRGSLRPSGRSPPFLLIGLSVALCIIGFNYWSVSSRNSELLGQISILKREVQNQATMRITADKRAEEVGSRANKYLEEKTKCMTDRRLIQDNADECVESSKACEADRTGLNERLQQVESELKEQQVKNIQSEKKCDLNSCLQPIGNIINILTNSIGKDAVRNPLIQNGIDVTALFKDLVGSNSMQGNLEKNKQYEDLNQTKLNFMPNKQQAGQDPGQEQQGQQPGQQQGSQGLQPGQQQAGQGQQPGAQEQQGQQAGQQQGSQGLQPGQQQGSQGQQPGQQQGSQGQQPGAQEQQGQQPGAQEQQGQRAGQLQGSQGQQPGQQQGSQGLQPGQQVQQGQQAEQQQGSQGQQQGGQGQEPGQQQGSYGLQPGQVEQGQEPGQQQGSQGLQPGQQVQQGQQAGQEQQGQQAGQAQQGQQQGSQGLQPGQQQGSQGLQPGQQQGSQGLQPGQQEQQGHQAGQEQQGQQAGQQQGSQGLQPGQQEQQGHQAAQEQQGQEPGQQQASQKQEPGQNQQQPLQGQEAGKLLQDLKQQIGKVSGQLNAGQQQPGQEQGQQQQGQELGQQQPGQEPGQQKAGQETGSQKLEQPLPGLPYNLSNVNSNKTASGDVKVKNEESPIQSKTELPNEQVKTTPKPEQNLEVKNQINKPEPKDNTDKQVPDQFVFQNLDKPQPNFNSENKIGFAPPHQILKPVDQKTDKDYSYDMKDDEAGQEAKDQKEQPNVVIEENSIDKLKKQLEEQEH